MLCSSTPPPASMPPHVPSPLVCLFVCFPSRWFPLIDGQWTSAKSNCTHSIRRGLGRRLRSSLLLNSSPRCDPPCRIVIHQSPSICTCSDSRRRLQNLSPSSFPSPTTMVTLKEQVALLTQQIQVLQNQLSACSPSPPVDPPPPPTTTKLLKIAAPTPFTGFQDDLDHFKPDCSRSRN